MTTHAQSARKSPRIRYRCASCSEKHEGFPALAYGRPDDVFELDAAELSARAHVSSDLCVLDGRRHFVRTVLSLPVHGFAQTFDFGPWVELSSEDFCRYAVHFVASPGKLQTMGGRLANALPQYPGSRGLACAIGYGVNGDRRPTVTLVDGDHVLARQQRTGIPFARAAEFVATMKGIVMLVE